MLPLSSLYDQITLRPEEPIPPEFAAIKQSFDASDRASTAFRQAQQDLTAMSTSPFSPLTPKQEKDSERLCKAINLASTEMHTERDKAFLAAKTYLLKNPWRLNALANYLFLESPDRQTQFHNDMGVLLKPETCKYSVHPVEEQQ